MENNDPKPVPQPTYIMDTKVEHRSHLDKLADVFLPEDLNSISNNIVNQVIIPAIMKTAGEILHRSIDMIFGTNYATGSSSPTSASSSSSTGWTGYQQIQNRNSAASSQPAGTLQILPVRQGVYDYAKLRFKDKDFAIHVVNNVRSVINSSGRCSVGKYLEFAGCGSSTSPSDFNWGWTNMSNVYYEETGDPDYPYRLVLPDPISFPAQPARNYI